MASTHFQFDLCRLPPQAEALRSEVRTFLQQSLQHYPDESRALSWMGFDAEFTKALGRQGWIGMTWPKAYGGHERSAFERYVLVEELLAAGAPVLAHWTADRQSGPLILNFGTEEQKNLYLPAICKGESYFCIGMSEPDAGSDLASVRTRARAVQGGWRVSGTKLWTTNAHRCHYMIALVRTDSTGPKHTGLTQLIIDLQAPGVLIRPIHDLAGESHFNEVVFDEVFVPSAQLIGAEGNGWRQVMSELAFERSGPERYLSTIALLHELIRQFRQQANPLVEQVVGELVAQVVVLRQMSLSVAAQLERHQDPSVEAAIVKELGTTFEQAMPELIQARLGIEASLLSPKVLPRVLAYITQVAPSFSLRGGTREIIRGIVAKGLTMGKA